MVILSIQVKSKPSKQREILSASRMIADQTRREKGCLNCRNLMDAENEDLFYMEQQWEQRSSMENYIQSDIFNALFGMIQVLGASWEIQINECIKTEGLEAVLAVKSKRQNEQF